MLEPYDLGPPVHDGLLLDLYELTMGQSYFVEGRHEDPVTFSVACRSLPTGWGYLLAAGLDDVLTDLEAFSLTEVALDYLDSTGIFAEAFLDHLRSVRFTGSVRAMPEGTPLFADEPLLELTAPLLQAQLVESVVLNRLHYQTLVATKASRCVDAAVGRRLIDLSVRRAPGPDAGLRVARATWLAGFDATSNVMAGCRYGIPVVGTMAHSYVQAFGDEFEAFRAFRRSFPNGVLLVDTYDARTGTERAVAAAGAALAGVRLDSGDLFARSREVRALLDGSGCSGAIILVSGGLDEYRIAESVAAGAAIDGFGLGTKVASSADAPSLEMAYKLVEYAGRPTFKVLGEQPTLAGAKQVWRVVEDGAFKYDTIEGARAFAVGEPLLVAAMEDGRRTVPSDLAEARGRAHQARLELPEQLRLPRTDAPVARLGPALSRLQHELRFPSRARPA